MKRADPMRVLIVDDRKEIRAEIQRLLDAAGVVVDCIEADNGAKALKLARDVDLVLCDVLMPEIDGFQFLRLFRAQPANATVPVIMLTGRDVAEDKIFGLEAGASDYVTKPFVPAELVARVKNQLKLKALQDELRAANDRLRELAITDYLTGVFNRRYFTELLSHEFVRCRRSNTPMSLALLDIDHFKPINDVHGHAAGDQVLCDFATLLRESFRESDTIARYGGEEFVVLFPHTPLDAAQTAVETLLRRLDTLALGNLTHGALSFSAGVCTYPSDRCDGPTSMLEVADRALYDAKAQGRKRVVCA